MFRVRIVVVDLAEREWKVASLYGRRELNLATYTCGFKLHVAESHLQPPRIWHWDVGDL